MAIIYKDETDVIHLCADEVESVEQEVHHSLQESVLSWGNLLIASGGLLTPRKCFYHLISFDWRVDGMWTYVKNKDREDLQLLVPQPNDTLAQISHLGVDSASKPLGSMTCPSGDPTMALAWMSEKVQSWIDTAKNVTLSQRNLWFLVYCQFLPRVGFVQGAIAAPLAALTHYLHHQYYQLLSIDSICQSVPMPIRYLGKEFYGSGSPHLGVEVVVKGIEKLLIR